MDLLERLRNGYRPPVDMLENEQPRELVAAQDINRTDPIGRTYCACPAGQPPAYWLKLTSEERQSLVEPPPPPPEGFLHPGAGGFTPEGVRLSGFTIENPK